MLLNRIQGGGDYIKKISALFIIVLYRAGVCCTRTQNPAHAYDLDSLHGQEYTMHFRLSVNDSCRGLTNCVAPADALRRRHSRSMIVVKPRPMRSTWPSQVFLILNRVYTLFTIRIVVGGVEF